MSSLMNTDDSEDKSEFASNLSIIRQIDFFSGMSMDVIKLFAFLCKRQSYKSGDTIFRQGDDDQCCYYILSGKANLVLKEDEKEHNIREYKAESYLGVMSLMTPMIKQFSLIAKEDTVCLVMTREAFSKVVDQFPKTPLRITRIIGNRLLQAEKKCITEYESIRKDEVKNLLGISLI